jgi:hypothetical protein
MFIENASSDSAAGSVRKPHRLATESCHARLAHDIRIALRRSGHAELRGVEIAVKEALVVITGSVPTFYLKQLSQEVTRTIAPDLEVRNDLQVCGYA